MIEWLKNRSRQEKVMIALIAVLLIGVVIRWSFVRREAGEAFRHRLEHFKAPQPPAEVAEPDPGPERDSGGWTVIRNEVTL